MDAKTSEHVRAAARLMQRSGQVKGVEHGLFGGYCTLGAVKKTGRRQTGSTMRALDEQSIRRWGMGAIAANDSGLLTAKHLLEFAGKARKTKRERAEPVPPCVQTVGPKKPDVAKPAIKKKSSKSEGDDVCCGSDLNHMVPNVSTGGGSSVSPLQVAAGIAGLVLIGGAVAFHAEIYLAVEILVGVVAAVMFVGVPLFVWWDNTGTTLDSSEKAWRKAEQKRRTALPAAEQVSLVKVADAEVVRDEPLALPAAAPVRVPSARVSSSESLRAADLAEERRAADLRREAQPVARKAS